MQFTIWQFKEYAFFSLAGIKELPINKGKVQIQIIYENFELKILFWQQWLCDTHLKVRITEGPHSSDNSYLGPIAIFSYSFL